MQNNYRIEPDMRQPIKLIIKMELPMLLERTDLQHFSAATSRICVM